MENIGKIGLTFLGFVLDIGLFELWPLIISFKDIPSYILVILVVVIGSLPWFLLTLSIVQDISE